MKQIVKHSNPILRSRNVHHSSVSVPKTFAAEGNVCKATFTSRISTSSEMLKSLSYMSVLSDSHGTPEPCSISNLFWSTLSKDLKMHCIGVRPYSSRGSGAFRKVGGEEATSILNNTESELQEKLLSLNTFVNSKESMKQMEGGKQKSPSYSIEFSSLQYETTVQSLKDHALRGNIESMLIIYNFLYNHGDCKNNTEKHAQLLRYVFLGYFHSGKFEHLIQMLLQCFEWKARKSEDLNDIPNSEVSQLEENVNTQFRELIRSITNPSSEADKIQMKKFFHCQKQLSPMHTHIIELLFDALAEHSHVSKMRKLLEAITAFAPQFISLNMTSLYNSFLRAMILKKEYKQAQSFFKAHFISPLNPESENLLAKTNEAFLPQKRTFLDLDQESDFRIHPLNFQVAEPDLYSYSMLITANIMNGDIVPAFSITEHLYKRKYYNVVIATQALLIQAFLHRNQKATIEDVQSVWNKYFEYNKKVEVRESTSPATSEGHNKCIPDSRAVSVYIISLLYGSKHDETLRLLRTYSDIYVPDPVSLELLLVSLLLHASKSQRLDFLDAAIALYNRYINTEGHATHRIKMPISFFEQIFSFSRVFLNTNAKNSITTFVETLLKDCFFYYKNTQVSGNLVKAAESLNLGFLLQKEDKDYSYKIPNEIASGIPQDLQIFPGIREKEHAFTIKEFVSIISLGALDGESLSEQVEQMKNIIKYHIQDPSIGGILFHYNEDYPPKNGKYYSIISGVKGIGKQEDYLISIPWTIKMIELNILKLKDPSFSKYLESAIEKWADFELVWTSLDAKRSVFPVGVGKFDVTSKQLQILARCIKTGSSTLTSQIQEAEQQLASQGVSFENQKDLIQAASLLRCAMQQEVDAGIREILKESSLSAEEQDQKIIQNLRKFCPETKDLLHQAQIMRGILNPDVVSDILYRCICMAAPIADQNKEARRLFAEHRIQLPQPVAERMKMEREKANILNPKHCPIEIRQSIYNECVMQDMSKQAQNDEAMKILCDLGYALPRAKVELEMRKAREDLMKKRVRAPGTIIPGAL